MTPGPGSTPDAQRRHLLDAARSVEAHAEGDDSELAAKALHLVACVAAVDHMCRGGDLPGVWEAKNAARGEAGLWLRLCARVLFLPVAVRLLIAAHLLARAAEAPGDCLLRRPLVAFAQDGGTEAGAGAESQF